MDRTPYRRSWWIGPRSGSRRDLPAVGQGPSTPAPRPPALPVGGRNRGAARPHSVRRARGRVAGLAPDGISVPAVPLVGPVRIAPHKPGPVRARANPVSHQGAGGSRRSPPCPSRRSPAVHYLKRREAYAAPLASCPCFPTEDGPDVPTVPAEVPLLRYPLVRTAAAAAAADNCAHAGKCLRGPCGDPLPQRNPPTLRPRGRAAPDLARQAGAVGACGAPTRPRLPRVRIPPWRADAARGAARSLPSTVSPPAPERELQSRRPAPRPRGLPSLLVSVLGSAMCPTACAPNGAGAR